MSFAAPWSPIETLLLALLCAATLFFTVITPPFQAPDENQHYMKALALAQGDMLTRQQGEAIGTNLPRAALDIHAVDFPTDVPPTLRRFDRTQIAASARRTPGAAGPPLPISPTSPAMRPAFMRRALWD